MDEIEIKPIEVTLTKLNIVGEFFYHTFKDSNGIFIEEETTEADYKQLETPEHVDPKKKGYVWMGSYSDYKYDSPSGKMEADTYADNGGCYRVLVDGMEKKDLEKSEIIDNKITRTKIDSIISEVSSLSVFNETK